MNRHHYTHSKETENIQHDFVTMDREEFEDLYGVELLEDGGVFDPVVNKHFDTFESWVADQVKEEEFAEFEHVHQNSKKFIDEGC